MREVPQSGNHFCHSILHLFQFHYLVPSYYYFTTLSLALAEVLILDMSNPMSQVVQRAGGAACLWMLGWNEFGQQFCSWTTTSIILVVF